MAIINPNTWVRRAITIVESSPQIRNTNPLYVEFKGGNILVHF